VGKAIPKMIGIARREYLRLGFQAPKGPRMNDAVTVSRILAAVGMARFVIPTTA